MLPQSSNPIGFEKLKRLRQMETAYIMVKGLNTKHIYMRTLRDKLIEEGWRVMYFIKGENLDITRAR